MPLFKGTVQNGTVVLEDGVRLPEGAIVTVLTDSDEPPVELPEGLAAELDDALDEADAAAPGDWVGEEFLEELKQRYG